MPISDFSLHKFDDRNGKNNVAAIYHTNIFPLIDKEYARRRSANVDALLTRRLRRTGDELDAGPINTYMH